MQQTENGGNHTLLDFVRQGVAIKRKMGKKCFCVTTEILHTKNPPTKTPCPYGNPAPKSHKTNKKKDDKRKAQ